MPASEFTFGSLFAGIGGFDLGLKRSGMTCKWQVELDDFCNQVLAKHWPDVARYGDVRDVGRHNLEPVDLICGGFPCQDVSLAGNRAGLNGNRSTMWSEFHRVICEIHPRWIIAENVPGLYSSDDGRFITKIFRELAACGYDAEWDCLPAALFGAPHERKRIFVVAYPNSIYGNQRVVFHKELTRALLKACNRQRAQLWAKAPAYPSGVANGVPHRVDRLRALGNAVVPQVAQWLGEQILAMEADIGR